MLMNNINQVLFGFNAQDGTRDPVDPEDSLLASVWAESSVSLFALP